MEIIRHWNRYFDAFKQTNNKNQTNNKKTEREKLHPKCLLKIL